jgi:hypothetical protein
MNERWDIDQAAVEGIITAYWIKFYCTTVCTLCGNSGVIDTTGVHSNAGVAVGRRNWCICPNGQASRHAAYGTMPGEDWHLATRPHGTEP